MVDFIPGPHVVLSVSDTGAGMTPEVRARLFEPFFTTKDSGHGTGLGLSMVQVIVRQSGGHILVDSEPNRGTTFKVYFPRQAELAAAPMPVPIRHNAAAVKGEGTILLAEDDRSVRRLVVTELSRRGFTVLEAEDGAVALEIIRNQPERIDALVTDVVMPRMNGADLAKAADRIRPGLKILFISGHPERAGAGLDPTGATNLLKKPFTADTLAARIKEMIAGRKEADGWS
jgi:CheY-like chemotaxis protein